MIAPELWERAAELAGRRLAVEAQINMNDGVADLLGEILQLIDDEEQLAADLGPGWQATPRGLLFSGPLPGQLEFHCNPDESGGLAETTP